MVELIQFLQKHAVDTSAIAAYIAASVLSTWPGNRIVAAVHTSRFLQFPTGGPQVTLKTIDKEHEQLLLEFDLRFAGIIGVAERLVYIYAVMFDKTALIAGWLVMKAFFGWLQKPRRRHDRVLRTYHTYLFGNVLSLLMGLLCGQIGIMIRTNLG